jgi:hypothetical protein
MFEIREIQVLILLILELFYSLLPSLFISQHPAHSIHHHPLFLIPVYLYNFPFEFYILYDSLLGPVLQKQFSGLKHVVNGESVVESCQPAQICDQGLG